MSHLLWEFDFGQIELVTLAWRSGDKNMRQVYLDGLDLHTRTAKGLFELTREPTEEERSDGKTMNFAQVYGKGVARYAAEFGIPIAKAERHFLMFNRTYPGVKIFFDGIEERVRKGLPIITPWGRMRTGQLLGDRSEESRRKDAHTILELKNFDIQSTASDITRFKLIKVFEWLDKTGWIRKIHPTNIVYDSIWGQATAEPATIRALSVVRDIMADMSDLPFNFDLPMGVDGKIGKSTSKADMKKLTFDDEGIRAALAA